MKLGFPDSRLGPNSQSSLTVALQTEIFVGITPDFMNIFMIFRIFLVLNILTVEILLLNSIARNVVLDYSTTKVLSQKINLILLERKYYLLGVKLIL